MDRLRAQRKKGVCPIGIWHMGNIFNSHRSIVIQLVLVVVELY